MSSLSSWLEARGLARTSKDRVLVLCRTRATASAARLALARRGGRLGVEIATPAGLAVQVAGPALGGGPLPPEPALPQAAAIAARIGHRPGLAALARRHTAAWRTARAAGAAEGAPAWLNELVERGWGDDDEQRARLALLERARLRGLDLGSGVGWNRVVPLGFDVAEELVEPWVRALLAAFGHTPRPAPAPPTAIDAVAVPDVLAEVRVAVDRARRDPDGTLVLVADEATASRLRDALRRNGLGCTWRAALPLSAHPLVPIVRRCLDWFAVVDPPIRASDLCGVIGRLRRAPSPRGAWPLVAIVERARLLDAPLSAWIARLAELANEGPEGAAAGARSARERLELLRHVLTSARPGLGALRTWLVAAGPPAVDDPALQTLLSRLEARATWPATPGHLAEVLGGSLEVGPLTEGVQVLHVDDYDGRPASQLILLDVHDRGLGRRLPPDPLLDDAALRAVGLPTAADLAAHRIDQVHRAVAAAGRAVAVVTRRDATGREVVPPVQLDLRVGDGGAGSHGVRLELAELQRVRAFERREGAPAPPRSGDTALDHLAVQATAEWYREGRGHVPAPALAPDWLLPWLGHAEIPEGRLPDGAGTWSEDELFRPLSHCPYQAWLRAVIRPRAPRAPREQLDARAVERAAREALAEVVPQARWRVDRARRSEAAQALAGALERATEAAMARAVGGEPLSAARRASAEAQARRWRAHWRRWADQAVRPARRVVTRDDLDALRQHPVLHAARVALVASVGPADHAPRWVVDEWLAWVADALDRGDRPQLWPDGDLLRLDERGALPASWAEAARRFLDRPELARLVALRRGTRDAAEVLLGPLEATRADVPYEVAELPLGEATIGVRGRIDRVDVVAGPDGPLLQLVAFTPGASPPDPRRAAAAVWSGSDPALLQALALRAGGGPDGRRARVGAVSWEPLRAVEPPRRGPVVVLLDDASLDAAAARLGRLLDAARAGRWPLRPRPDTCPALARWGHDGCPYGEVCRLRGLPEAPR